MAPVFPCLSSLRGLRSAPALPSEQREQLRAELLEVMRPCSWFTIGVMASSAEQALRTLRRWEAALGWTPLVAAEGECGDSVAGSVFLKGHQANGSFRLRPEEGLGEGVLIAGQNPGQPDLADTWGPLPLDLF